VRAAHGVTQRFARLAARRGSRQQQQSRRDGDPTRAPRSYVSELLRVCLIRETLLRSKKLKLEEAQAQINMLENRLAENLAGGGDGSFQAIRPNVDEMSKKEKEVIMFRTRAEMWETRCNEMEAALEEMPRQWASEIARLEIQVKEKDAQIAGGFGSMANLKLGTRGADMRRADVPPPSNASRTSEALPLSVPRGMSAGDLRRRSADPLPAIGSAGPLGIVQAHDLVTNPEAPDRGVTQSAWRGDSGTPRSSMVDTLNSRRQESARNSHGDVSHRQQLSVDVPPKSGGSARRDKPTTGKAPTPPPGSGGQRPASRKLSGGS